MKKPMKNKSTRIPFEVVERFAFRNGISLSDSVNVNESMLNYLDRAAESKDSISPDKLQDEAWHNFMLHSKDYVNFCKERYGHYIHHVPTGMNRDPFATKVQQLLEIKKNRQLAGKDCESSVDACGKHLCSSDCNPPSGQRSMELVAANCYNSCSNGSCGVSNCNSDGDAGH